MPLATTEDVADYHRYPIADNDSPRLAADRLEYTLGNLFNYGFCSPEQLRELSPLCKSGKVTNLATVWSSARRKGDGTSPWDGKIVVSFSADRRGRYAGVLRYGTDDTPAVEIAVLKYNAALEWCNKNLQLSSTADARCD